MKYLSLLLLLFILSCDKNNDKKEMPNLDGLYNLEEPLEEKGNVYIFGREDLFQFVDNSEFTDNKHDSGHFHSYSTFKYYIEGDRIFTCLSDAMQCSNKSDYELHFKIQSVDTLEDSFEVNQVVILKRNKDNVLHKLVRVIKHK